MWAGVVRIPCLPQHLVIKLPAENPTSISGVEWKIPPKMVLQGLGVVVNESSAVCIQELQL